MKRTLSISQIKSADVFALALAVSVSLLAGVIGSFFTISEIPNWYSTLEKPFFTPPNWIFGPVWTTLYIMMGVALFFACRYGKPAKKATTTTYWFYAQLLFNTLWSVIFFGFHALWPGFVVILILWLLLLRTTQLFFTVKNTAGWLLIPYLIWVSFASLLNFSIALLNT